MKAFMDLHVHTCLSPCADDEMTPNNIVNMAAIKKLDVLAITDHNSGRNLPAVEKLAKEKDILLLPGVEVTTSEEIHILCYFAKVDEALEFCSVIESHLGPTVNRGELFGRQIVMDEHDQVLEEVEPLLVQATDLSMLEVTMLCQMHCGVPVPAHINKESNSLLTTLGTIPPECEFATLELHRNSPQPTVDISGYRLTRSSDAHNLASIFERVFSMDIQRLNTQSILQELTNFESQRRSHCF